MFFNFMINCISRFVYKFTNFRNRAGHSTASIAAAPNFAALPLGSGRFSPPSEVPFDVLSEVLPGASGVPLVSELSELSGVLLSETSELSELSDTSELPELPELSLFVQPLIPAVSIVKAITVVINFLISMLPFLFAALVSLFHFILTALAVFAIIRL